MFCKLASIIIIFLCNIKIFLPSLASFLSSDVQGRNYLPSARPRNILSLPEAERVINLFSSPTSLFSTTISSSLGTLETHFGAYPFLASGRIEALSLITSLNLPSDTLVEAPLYSLNLFLHLRFAQFLYPAFLPVLILLLLLYLFMVPRLTFLDTLVKHLFIPSISFSTFALLSLSSLSSCPFSSFYSCFG